MSSGMEIRVTGDPRAAFDRVRRKLSQAVQEAARDVEGAAKTAIQDPAKSGRMYGGHRASAPGEAPASHTGNLAASIRTDQLDEFTAEIGVAAEYGAHLEYGTARMAPRPYLGPALEQAREPFQEAVERVMRGGP